MAAKQTKDVIKFKSNTTQAAIRAPPWQYSVNK